MRRRGQALVEFAFAVSVFMLLVLGTFDLARAYLAYTVVANAAREACRYGMAHVSETGWQTAARQAGLNLAVGVDPAELDLTVRTTIADAPPYVGVTYISVSGTYRFHSVTPFVGAVLGDPIPISVDTSAIAG
jgi:Flp pilus assembly protein TadG